MKRCACNLNLLKTNRDTDRIPDITSDGQPVHYRRHGVGTFVKIYLTKAGS